MSSPQLTDANRSSEWFRTVAGPGASEKTGSPSQAAIPLGARRKRFVRLVTYTMAGLVAFTLLGITSFAIRQSSMRKALAAPAPAPLAVAAPDSGDTASPRPALLAEIPMPTDSEVDAAPPRPPAAVNKTTPPAAKRSKTTTKVTKVAKRSPFLGGR
jgi:hypothetical protein